MKEVNTQSLESFETKPCPECGKETGLINLGTEPAREVCGRLNCNWSGEKL